MIIILRGGGDNTFKILPPSIIYHFKFLAGVSSSVGFHFSSLTPPLKKYEYGNVDSSPNNSQVQTFQDFLFLHLSSFFYIFKGTGSPVGLSYG